MVAAVAAQYSCSTEISSGLVPEGILAAKCRTHLDEPGTIYFAPDGGSPLWFNLGKGSSTSLIPTLWTLNKQRDLVPTVMTHPEVLPFLAKGADLMSAGLASPPAGSLKHLDMVSVSVKGRSPVGIGYMAASAADIRANERKGKAVEMMHVWDDELWALGAIKPELEDQNAPADQPTTVELQMEPSLPSLAPSEVDSILRLGLLQYLHSSQDDVKWPLPAGELYSRLLPFRPHYAPSSSAVVANSSYRKASRFMMAMEKEGIISLKKAVKGGGDISVTAADLSHPAVRDHSRHRTLASVSVEAEPAPAAVAMVIRELWQSSKQTSAFWSSTGHPPDAVFTLAEIAAALGSYVQARKLVHPADPAFIRLDDPALAAALLSKGESQTRMRRDEAVSRLRLNMTARHSIGHGPLINGPVPHVSVTTKQRRNKDVTLISGLEHFGLDPVALSDELKVKCAGAATVSPLQGSKSGLEVLVQGKHERVVVETLALLGLPSRYIQQGTGKRKS